ncbi:hypothetical protein MUN82_17120 [Hymenobacter aerilatus]|uniref:Uncharacterized protein n=1 Tax=Hymenobacter aerilatus TaxID=2932251 RepID=A0A8T9SR80_9BACT|nr:hypothetical protein [Hymenobacter aerilatus]UOR04658.1 hypothetical protein MUN82_17120 [Hymenobacter aerilatus]
MAAAGLGIRALAWGCGGAGAVAAKGFAVPTSVVGGRVGLGDVDAVDGSVSRTW